MASSFLSAREIEYFSPDIRKKSPVGDKTQRACDFPVMVASLGWRRDVFSCHLGLVRCLIVNRSRRYGNLAYKRRGRGCGDGRDVGPKPVRR